MILLWYSLQLSHGVHWCIRRVNSFLHGPLQRSPPQRVTFTQPEEQGDIFCGVKQRAGKREVVLRLETMSAAEAKMRKAIVSCMILLGLVSMVVLTVLKSMHWQKNPLELLRYDGYTIGIICIAATAACAPLTIRTVVFIHRIIQTYLNGEHWAPRRRRMATLALANAITQLINVACWIAPNALILGNLQRQVPACVWFTPAIDALGCIRWTCWNTTFLIWIVMAHSLEVDMPHKAGAKGASAVQVSGKMVLDRPLSWHWKKLILWMLLEAMVILLVLPISERPPQPKILRGTEADCRQWDWAGVCKYTPLTDWPAIGISVFSGAYSWIHTTHIVKTHWQLESRLFKDTRAARVLWSIQAESIMLAFHTIFASLNALWFSNSDSCWSYVVSWLGMLPLQLVAAAVAWQNCWLFTPSSSAKDPVLQVWLSEFAWTEASLQKTLAGRNAHAQNEHERAALLQQPMFCFETALKLHVWSCLVYTDVGQASHKDGMQGREWWRSDLAGWSKDGSTSSEANLTKGRFHATSQPSELWLDDAAVDDSIAEDWEGDAASDAERGHSHSIDSPCAPSRLEDTDMGMQPSTSGSDAKLEGWLCSEESELHSEGEKQPAAKRLQTSRREQRRLRAARLLRTAMGEFGLTDMETFWDHKYDTKAILGWNKTTMVLSFRGTASFTNACADIKVWRMPHAPVRGILWAGTRPLVHTGFYTVWLSTGFGPLVLQHLQLLVKTGQVQEDARICVTGHSMGGALAMLAAHDIATRLSHCRLQVYPMGCPRPGNHAFARDYQALVPDTWNVMEERDPVVRAGKLFCFFARPGHRVMINQRGELLVRPSALELQIKQPASVSHHTNLAYRAAMLAVCLAQFSSCGVRGGAQGVLELANSPFVHRDLKHDGLDFHRLRRLARWGVVGSSRVAPPTPQELRQLMAPAADKSWRNKWKPKPAESPWAREPRLTVAALQKYRSDLSREKERARLEQSEGASRNDCK